MVHVTSGSDAAPGQRRTLALLATAGFSSSANIRLFDSLLPQISLDFGVTAGEAARLAAAYALSYGLFQVVMGPLGDRIGKYRLVRLLCLASFATTLAGALAATFGQLLLARLLSGASAAAIVPLSIAWIGDTVPAARRPHVLAVFMSVMLSGVTIGQVIGGFTGQWTDWRVAPALVALLFLGAGLALSFGRDNSAAEQPGGLSLARILRLPVDLLGRRWHRGVLLAVAIEGIGYCCMSFAGLLMAERFDTGLALVGAILALYAVGGVFNPLMMRLMLPRLGQARYFAMTSGLTALGLLIMALTPVIWVVPVAVMLTGLGAAATHSALQGYGTQLVPEARSTGFGYFAMTFFLAQSLATAVLGVVADLTMIALPFLIGAGAMLILGLWAPARLGPLEDE